MNGILYLNVKIFEDKDLFERGVALLSKERQERMNKLKNGMPARLSLGAGLLLRMAMERNGLADQKENIKYGKYGKPYLEGIDFHFSLSHSGEYAVCAYSDRPIGADLQRIKDKIPDHTNKILSEAEKGYLESRMGHERTIDFYRLWSRKESLLKWDGRGLGLPMQELSFIRQNMWSEQFVFEEKTLWFREFDVLFPKYTLCVCSEKGAFSTEPEDVTAEILTKY